MTQHLINIAIDHINQRIGDGKDPHGLVSALRTFGTSIDGKIDETKRELSDTISSLDSVIEGLGDLAWTDKVEKAMLGETVIVGGYLRTELIEAGSIGAEHIRTSELIVGDNIAMGPNAKISWNNFTSEVIENLEEVQMRWRGSLNAFPTDPKKNDAFYHTTNLSSYVYNGSSWQIISKDGTTGPQGELGPRGYTGPQGPQGATGAKGDPGSYYAPGYLKSTYIDATQIHSPTLMGETLIGSTGQVGMTAAGTASTDVRFWAGATYANRASAPFQVLQDGTVSMTKANIQTGDTGMYVKLSGSKVEGGNFGYGTSYSLGTATISNGYRSGVLQLTGYSGSTSSTASFSTQIFNNAFAVKGSNLVLGGQANTSHPTVITRTISTIDLTQEVGSATALYVRGDMQTSGTMLTWAMTATGPVQVLSLTLPGTTTGAHSNVEGRIIYEASSKRLRFYNGTSWVYISTVQT